MAIVFFHVPRTGGHSMREVLRCVYGDVTYDDNFDPAKPYCAHIPFSSTWPIGTKLVMFFRHPVTRIVSLYHYIKQLRGEGLERYTDLGFNKRWNMDQFLLFRMANIHNGMTKQLAGLPFLYEMDQPMVTDEVFRIALSNLSHLHLIGLTNEYEKAVQRMAKLLDWPYIPDIPQLNGVSKKRANREEHWERIVAANVWDIKLYDEVTRRTGRS